jgi:hypothetical protein
MERKLEVFQKMIGKALSRRDLRVSQNEAASDPFVHLGSAVELTKSQENGTIDDGEIHGAYRLKQR